MGENKRVMKEFPVATTKVSLNWGNETFTSSTRHQNLSRQVAAGLCWTRPTISEPLLLRANNGILMSGRAFINSLAFDHILSN